MKNLHKNVVRDFLNGIILLSVVVLVALVLFVVGIQNAHASDCYVCGCTTPEVETIEISGNAL